MHDFMMPVLTMKACRGWSADASRREFCQSWRGALGQVYFFSNNLSPGFSPMGWGQIYATLRSA
jgi:hypothetical protein